MSLALARRAAMRPGDTVLRDVTDGRGVDIVVDPFGGSAFDDAVRVLALDGKLLVIAFAAGAVPTVKVHSLLLRNVEVLGVAWRNTCIKCLVRPRQSPGDRVNWCPRASTTASAALPVVGRT